MSLVSQIIDKAREERHVNKHACQNCNVLRVENAKLRRVASDLYNENERLKMENAKWQDQCSQTKS